MRQLRDSQMTAEGLRTIQSVRRPSRRTWSLFRPAQSPRPLVVAVGFVSAYIILALAAYHWTTSDSGLAVLWLNNGLLAVGFLLLPRTPALLFAALAWTIDLTLSLTEGGNGPGQSVLIATVDLSEAILAAMLVRRLCGAALDMTRIRRLSVCIVGAILPATFLASSVGTALSHLLFQADPLPLFGAWFGGDFLGMIVAIPAVLLIARPDRFGRIDGARRWVRLALIGLLALITTVVFVQNAVHALMFLVLMSALLATFVLSPACVAASTVIITFIVSGLTIAGYGPIAADEPDSMGRRILVQQFFLVAVVVSSLVSTAMLAERARIQASLTRTLTAVREAHRQAGEAARAKARFLATMSHEMRTPLNGVMGTVQLLSARRDMPRDAQPLLATALASSHALACLIDDVLDFSELDVERLGLQSGPMRLRDLLETTAAMARQMIGDQPIKLTVELGQGCDTTYLADTRRLSQVLLQLLRNAVKFTPRGSIRLTANTTPQESGGLDLCQISVEDTGIGISGEQLPRIFDAFHQADDSTTRRYGGAGLGLSICRSLVELMGGRMTVSSRLGEGSRFSIELGLARALCADSPCAEPKGAGDTDDHDAAPPQVLVVDDHPVNRQVASALLVAAGCEVFTCENGAEAVAAVADRDFDAIFLDVHMPVMDGLDACRAIRAMPGRKGQAPIVAMTAAAGVDDIDACLAAGMNAHLSKPLRGQQLVEALLRHTTRAGNIITAA